MKMTSVNGKVFFGGLALAVFFLFPSCQTIQQDLLLSSAGAASGEILAELESLIVPLDDSPARQEIARARQRVTELERDRNTAGDFAASLAAWSGRLYLVEGKRGEAARQLRLSRQGQGGGVQSLILALRLEEDDDTRLAKIAEAAAAENFSGGNAGGGRNYGLLEIERAIIRYKQKRYREAAAAFDNAFAVLGAGLYQDTWRAARNAAWELRDTDGSGGTGAILSKPVFTWLDLVELTRTETDMLRFLTAGRTWPAGDLFARLLDRGFIPPGPRPEDPVPRAGAAWFLWRLYAEQRGDPDLLARYSARYRQRGSPIPDIPVDSPFFDAVLGCVEREIMELPDGRRFLPGESLRGAAFLAMLRKAGVNQ